MKGFILGLIFGLLILPACFFWWLHHGNLPVAVADVPLPMEKSITHQAMHRRIDAEAPVHPGMAASPTNLMLGAEVYRAQCAACHGLYGRPSSFGGRMFPAAPQLWAPHDNGVVGVSDDTAGETYWKVKNGIRLSGMPAFSAVLNDAQMWQVSILLAHAADPLPNDVMTLLKQPLIPQADRQVPTGPSGPMEFPVVPLPQQ